MGEIIVAAVQTGCGEKPHDNLTHMESLVRRAASDGAHIICLPELFERQYFCKTQRGDFLSYATTAADNPAVQAMRILAAELKIVIPVSFYERAGQVLFNSLAVIDADGEVLGIYRKSHIPDGPGYQEKFYFSPGDTGFCVWPTKHAIIGAAICWDQWFPESARAMALQGAELLLYPTAIGSEPQAPDINSAAHWRAVMCGHAGANMMPLVAANRIGCEQQQDAFGHTVKTIFYGQSFIADQHGKIVAAADAAESIIMASFDTAAIYDERQQWGLFRDRRPDLYGVLLSKDGEIKHAPAKFGGIR